MFGGLLASWALAVYIYFTNIVRPFTCQHLQTCPCSNVMCASFAVTLIGYSQLLTATQNLSFSNLAKFNFQHNSAPNTVTILLNSLNALHAEVPYKSLQNIDPHNTILCMTIPAKYNSAFNITG